MHPCPVDQLVRQRHVVLQVVLVSALSVPADGAQHVAGVAERALGDCAVDGPHGVDAEEQVVAVVERVEHAEDVDAGRVRLPGELADHIVRVRGVPHGVGAAEEHLQGHIGHGRAQQLEAPPGALVQEAQRDVERGPAPDLEGGRRGEGVRREGRGPDEVVGAHSGGEQRLVRIAHGGVRDEEAPVGSHGRGPPFGPSRGEDVLPSRGRRGVERGGGLLLDRSRRSRRRGGGRRRGCGRRSAAAGEERRPGSLGRPLGWRRAHRPGVRRPVDHDVRQVRQKLRRLKLVGGEGEQRRVPLDEARRRAAREELRVAEHVFEEQDVGLDSPNLKLVQRTLHLLHRMQKSVGLADYLDQKRIIVARDDVSRCHRAVEADAGASRGAVGLDASGVGLKLALGVLI